MKTRVTKCYLIEVVDSEGYAVTDDFWFGTRKEAEEKANALKNYWLSLHPEAQDDTDCAWK